MGHSGAQSATRLVRVCQDELETPAFCLKALPRADADAFEASCSQDEHLTPKIFHPGNQSERLLPLIGTFMNWP